MYVSYFQVFKFDEKKESEVRNIKENVYELQ